MDTKKEKKNEQKKGRDETINQEKEQNVTTPSHAEEDQVWFHLHKCIAQLIALGLLKFVCIRPKKEGTANVHCGLIGAQNTALTILNETQFWKTLTNVSGA